MELPAAALSWGDHPWCPPSAGWHWEGRAGTEQPWPCWGGGKHRESWRGGGESAGNPFAVCIDS